MLELDEEVFLFVIPFVLSVELDDVEVLLVEPFELFVLVEEDELVLLDELPDAPFELFVVLSLLKSNRLWLVLVELDE